MIRLKMLISALMVAMLLPTFAFAKSDQDIQYQRDWKMAVDAYKRGDKDNSVPYFMIDAGLGIPDGSHAMGVVYEEGVVLPQNSKMAMKYFACNAEAGYWKSQGKLAILYEDGVLVKRNLQEAYFWSLIVTSNIPPDSTPELKKSFITVRNHLSKKLSPEVVEKIQKKASAWTPTKKVCYFEDSKV